MKGMILFIFLTMVGMLLLFKPVWFWEITERWKSRDASEPSDLYFWNTRIGGLICTIIGIAGLIVYFWNR
ncbi:conserved hypothetical protein [[Clostridium] ultunense Esp]|nr:conserved hypothetical protein [[Clostridium] ultunense Esp]